MILDKKEIIVEERLAEVFGYLPKMTAGNISYKPVFKYGDAKEINAFFKANKGTEMYPLIWMLYPYKELHKKNRVDVVGVSFILAVSTDSEMFNDQRIKETYKLILIPLLNNIKRAFRLANIINMKDEFTVIKFPNYNGEGDTGTAHEVSHIWDAIKVTVDISINNVCLRPINL